MEPWTLKSNKGPIENVTRRLGVFLGIQSASNLAYLKKKRPEEKKEEKRNAIA